MQLAHSPVAIEDLSEALQRDLRLLWEAGSTTMPTSQAVDLLVSGESSTEERGRAILRIRALAQAGAVRYNEFTERVTVLLQPPQAGTGGQSILLQQPSLQKLSPQRRWVLWAVLEIAREQRTDMLSARGLPNLVYERLKANDCPLCPPTINGVYSVLNKLMGSGFFHKKEGWSPYTIPDSTKMFLEPLRSWTAAQAQEARRQR